MGSFPTQYRHTGGVSVDVIQNSGSFSVGAGGPVSVAKSVVKEGDITKTEFIFDLTGMASVATTDDIIGGTGAAFIMKLDSVTGTNIKFAELVCLEEPTTGEPNLNLVASATEDLESGDAGPTDSDVITPGGDFALGTRKVGGAFDASTKDHLYLAGAAASNGNDAGTYDAGIFKLTLYTV